jgi:hypothetical protein
VGETKDGNAVLLNPQTQNSYSYANRNPINSSDKSGRLTKEAFENDPVGSTIRASLWDVASLAGNVFNLPFSAQLIRRSSSYEPGNLNIDSSNQKNFGNVIDKIKDTRPYQEFIKTAIKNAENGKMTTPGSLGFESYDNRDLYYSMHLVNINTSVEKGNDGWVVNSTISDKYDFNQTNPSTYKGKIIKTPATAAYSDQGKGILSNYTTNININDKVPYEKK